ncbi:complex I NDUFA9 subunit family protein [Rhodovulum sp. 12E13]|uniref:complex I NDUFA9 subunit family protein n=1 Tax=Rhodovulum sp. 12E13 TaxID=2203891 RepID=UPI000E15FBF8|nr:complex I NDUFA9 subunit family protein [Rhodovulum sp. 12E13]RDC71312.1 complex I NDUFA9 subunit family protein [Rhodovulum sp. 12E13]
MARVTVFGGTGFLGRQVVRHLAADGHHVRVAARRPPECGGQAGVEAVRADLLDPGSVARTLDGADGVVNAVSLYVETRALSFEDVHVEGAARLAREARARGVDRIVQVSGIGADPHARDAYIRARGRGEAAVRDAASEAAIARPSVLMGPGDGFLSTILSLLRRTSLHPLFGSGSVRLQPVHVADAAQGLARLATHPHPPLLAEFGGADRWSYRAIVEAAARAAGSRVHAVPVPFAVWRALAGVSERLPGAPLTRHQIALMESDKVVDPGLPGLPELGVVPRGVTETLREMTGRT